MDETTKTNAGAADKTTVAPATTQTQRAADTSSDADLALIPAEGEAKKAEGAEKKTEATKTDEPAGLKASDLKLKEGFDLGEGGVAEAIATMKDLGITTKEGAQKALDYFAERFTTMKTQAEAEKKEAWKTQVTTWRKETEADKEVGGQNLAANREYALKAVREKGTPGFKNLVASGFGNNIDAFKFLVAVGKMLSEDTPTQSTTGGEPDKSLGKALFPDVPKTRGGN